MREANKEIWKKRTEIVKFANKNGINAALEKYRVRRYDIHNFWYYKIDAHEEYGKSAKVYYTIYLSGFSDSEQLQIYLIDQPSSGGVYF
jgi:hypothetical protein